jgi:hypothetical protein
MAARRKGTSPSYKPPKAKRTGRKAPVKTPSGRVVPGGYYRATPKISTAPTAVAPRRVPQTKRAIRAQPKIERRARQARREVRQARRKARRLQAIRTFTGREWTPRGLRGRPLSTGVGVEQFRRIEQRRERAAEREEARIGPQPRRTTATRSKEPKKPQRKLTTAEQAFNRPTRKLARQAPAVSKYHGKVRKELRDTKVRSTFDKVTDAAADVLDVTTNLNPAVAVGKGSAKYLLKPTVKDPEKTLRTVRRTTASIVGGRVGRKIDPKAKEFRPLKYPGAIAGGIKHAGGKEPSLGQAVEGAIGGAARMATDPVGTTKELLKDQTRRYPIVYGGTKKQQKRAYKKFPKSSYILDLGYVTPAGRGAAAGLRLTAGLPGKAGAVGRVYSGRAKPRPGLVAGAGRAKPKSVPRSLVGAPVVRGLDKARVARQQRAAKRGTRVAQAVEVRRAGGENVVLPLTKGGARRQRKREAVRVGARSRGWGLEQAGQVAQDITKIIRTAKLSRVRDPYKAQPGRLSALQAAVQGARTEEHVRQWVARRLELAEEARKTPQFARRAAAVDAADYARALDDIRALGRNPSLIREVQEGAAVAREVGERAAQRSPRLTEQMSQSARERPINRVLEREPPRAAASHVRGQADVLDTQVQKAIARRNRKLQKGRVVEARRDLGATRRAAEAPLEGSIPRAMGGYSGPVARTLERQVRAMSPSRRATLRKEVVAAVERTDAEAAALRGRIDELNKGDLDDPRVAAELARATDQAAKLGGRRSKQMQTVNLIDALKRSAQKRGGARAQLGRKQGRYLAERAALGQMRRPDDPNVAPQYHGTTSTEPFSDERPFHVGSQRQAAYRVRDVADRERKARLVRAENLPRFEDALRILRTKADPTPEDLDQITSLEARIARMRAAQSSEADAMVALVDEVPDLYEVRFKRGARVIRLTDSQANDLAELIHLQRTGRMDQVTALLRGADRKVTGAWGRYQRDQLDGVVYRNQHEAGESVPYMRGGKRQRARTPIPEEDAFLVLNRDAVRVGERGAGKVYTRPDVVGAEATTQRYLAQPRPEDLPPLRETPQQTAARMRGVREEEGWGEPGYYGSHGPEGDQARVGGQATGAALNAPDVARSNLRNFEAAFEDQHPSTAIGRSAHQAIYGSVAAHLGDTLADSFSLSHGVAVGAKGDVKHIPIRSVDPDTGVIQGTSREVAFDTAAYMGRDEWVPINIHDLTRRLPEEAEALLEAKGGDQVRSLLREARESTRDTGGWFVVHKDAIDTLASTARHHGRRERVLNRVLKGAPSTAILMANPGWLLLQGVNNAMLSALWGVAPANARRIARELERLDPKAAELLQAELGSKITSADTAPLGTLKTVGGHARFLPNAWRAYRGTWVGRNLSYDALFRGDAINNAFFRNSAAYRQAQVLHARGLTSTLDEVDALRAAGKHADADELRNAGLARAFGDAIQGTDRILAPLLRRGGKMTPEDYVRMIREPEVLAKLGDDVAEMFGNYTRFGKVARDILSRNVMFYGFMRFSLRMLLYTMPIKHPAVTATLGHLSRLQEEEVRRLIGEDIRAAGGKLKGSWEGELPFGSLSSFYFMRDGRLRSESLARINPLYNSVIQSLSGALGGRENILGAAGSLSPVIGEAVAQLTGIEPFTGKPMKVRGPSTGPLAEAYKKQSWRGLEPNDWRWKLNTGAGREIRGRILLNHVAQLFGPTRVAQQIGAGGQSVGEESFPWDRRPIYYSPEDDTPAERRSTADAKERQRLFEEDQGALRQVLRLGLGPAAAAILPEPANLGGRARAAASAAAKNSPQSSKSKKKRKKRPTSSVSGGTTSGPRSAFSGPVR